MNAKRTGLLLAGICGLALVMMASPRAQLAGAGRALEGVDRMSVEKEDGTMHVTWKAVEHPAAGEPATVAFRDGRGLRFNAAARTGLELNGQAGRAFWAARGPLTLAMVVQAATLDSSQSPLCSKWISVDGKRSFELGLANTGRLYWQVSASGNADERRSKMEGSHGLQAGKPYAVAAVFDPGRRMAIYVNGHLSGELLSNVPDSICNNDTPVVLGAQASLERFSDVVLGDIWIHPRALDGEAIAQWASALALTEEPPDGRTPWERAVLAPDQVLPPVRALTHGPRPHWFGYYDKFQTDPTERYVLSMEADFDLRVPGVSDVARIGMIDTQDGDKWIPLAETTAWNFQQGCMLQWRPGSDREILYNDREGDHFVTHALDVKTGKKRTLPLAIDQVHPNGKIATCQDYARMGAMRTVIGYAVDDVEKYRRVPAPEDSGIWLMDLDTGEHKLVVSEAQAAKIAYPNQKPTDRLYVAHTQWSPDGKRFLFFTRGDTIDSRLMTAAMDGSDLRFLTYQASHYDWCDPTHVLIEIPRRGGFFLFKDDGSGQSERVFSAPPGHQSYLPGNKWLLSDTIPIGRERIQHVYLVELATGRIVPIGHFHQPPAYRGDVRCDNHPRQSRDGTKVIIDSTHGDGRQMYMIDISGIVGEAKTSG